MARAMDGLASLRDTTWLYVAAPLLGLAGIWLSWQLRFPQLLRLASSIRGLRTHAKSEGPVSPGLGATLAAVGSFGAAGAVGAATAVALGGAGAIAWVWLFGLVLAPLMFAETLLARTDAPGRGDAAASGSLARRLRRSSGVFARATGTLLVLLVVVTAFTFVGGVHGAAIEDAASQLLPDSAPWLLGGVAAVGALLASAGPTRAASLAGWLGLAGLVAVAVAAVWAAAADPGAAFGALGRTIGEALEGSPAATPFSGAFAGEIAFVAMLHVLPPFSAAAGVTGSVHALARARSTKAQAAVSLLGPFAFAVITTLLGMAFVATGAFYHQVEHTRQLDEVRFYETRFETASQRIEGERLYRGYVRVRDGQMRDYNLHVGTERGMIDGPRFRLEGEPANFALQVEQGQPFRMLRPGPQDALSVVSPDQIERVTVRGKMLPRGGGLLHSAFLRSPADQAGARLALAGLLALAAVAAAVWGLGLRASLPRGTKRPVQVLVALVPAAGIGLQATGSAPWLGPVGGIAAAVLVSVVAIVLIARSGEAAKLAGD